MYNGSIQSLSRVCIRDELVQFSAYVAEWPWTNITLVWLGQEYIYICCTLDWPDPQRANLANYSVVSLNTTGHV
jgi:hypothetical protein